MCNDTSSVQGHGAGPAPARVGSSAGLTASAKPMSVGQLNEKGTGVKVRIKIAKANQPTRTRERPSTA